MRHRRHTWRQAIEMTVAMVMPMVVLVALAVGVAVPWLPVQSLPVLTHVGMLLGMVALMLYRRDQYVHGSAHRGLRDQW